MECLTLTPEDVQKLMGIGRAGAYALFNREDFPTIRIGRRLLVSRDAFMRWLDAQSDSHDKHAEG